MAVGQYERMRERFGEMFSRVPTPGEWYLLGRHGFGGVANMLQNPGMPAWVAQYWANRPQATPDTARRSIMDHIPEQLRQRFAPGGVNSWLSDNYLHRFNQMPMQQQQSQTGTIVTPNWDSILGGQRPGNPGSSFVGSPSGYGNFANQLQQHVLNPAANGLGGGGNGGGGSSYAGNIWPWAPNASASQSPSSYSFSGALGNWNGNG